MRSITNINRNRDNFIAAWSPDNTRLLVANISSEEDRLAGFLHRRRKTLRVVLYGKNGGTLWEKMMYSNCDPCKLVIGWKDDSNAIVVADNEKVRILGKDGVLIGEASIRKHLLYGEKPVRVYAGDERVSIDTNIGSTIIIVRGKTTSVRRRRLVAKIVYNLLSLVGGDSERINYSISPNHKLVAFSIESYLQVSSMSTSKLWGRDLGGYINQLEWHPSSTSILSTVANPEYTYGVLTSLSGGELWRTLPFKGVFLDASWSPGGEEAALLLYNDNSCSIVRYTYEGEPVDTVDIDYCPTVTWTPMGDLSLVNEDGFSLVS
ncbi:MAG: hypothetical protein F7B60_05660 [Desulfurococcales archaeon]|nr:hypothetical protein [Desulfurococcales archaeon]